MKTQVMEDKPDFEQIAKHSNPNVVSDKYTYDSEGHQSLNPKWARAQEAAETYARCEVVGMERIWKQYVLPLQSELSSAQEKNKWISVKDEWPLEILDVLWCRVPVEEPPVVASMCDEGFDETYWTHWRPLPPLPELISEIENKKVCE